MRKWFFVLFVGLSSVSFGQAFHVDDTSTVLIKNTSQSPAHWYIEVISDVPVDTILRWKMRFNGIPAQWTINYDDGTTNFPLVNDGDSSDFILPTNLPYPHKLIIGAMLNNTAGQGIVYVDLYDPATPENIQTISYEFIISLAGLEELESSDLFAVQNNTILVLKGQLTVFTVYNESGQILTNQETNSYFDMTALPKNQVLFLALKQNDRAFVLKFIL